MKEKKVLMAQLLHTPVITAVYCLLVIKLHLDAFIHLDTFLILRKLQPINPFIFFFRSLLRMYDFTFSCTTNRSAKTHSH